MSVRDVFHFFWCRYSNNYVDHYVWNKLIQCQVYVHLRYKATGVIYKVRLVMHGTISIIIICQY